MAGRTTSERVAREPFVVSDGEDLRNLRGPAVVMVNPKFIVNVASMIRNCAAFGIDTLCLTGERIEIPTGKKGKRLPRQERMREYRTVQVVQHDFPLTLFASSIVPVCVELLPSALPLPIVANIDANWGAGKYAGVHADEAVYILGPEDGSVPAGLRACCHNFVTLPTMHCLNVAQAGGIVLYDRVVSRWRAGLADLPELAESRGRG